MPLIGTPDKRGVGSEGGGGEDAESSAARADLGRGPTAGRRRARRAPPTTAGPRCRRAGCGRRWWRRWRTARRRPRRSGSTTPTNRRCPGPDRLPSGRPSRGRRARAATASWWPRSRGRGPGRSAPGPGGGGRRLVIWAQISAVLRSCQTMARWDGCPVRRSQATTVSRWLVMPMARTTRSWSFSRPPTSVEGGTDLEPDLVRILFDPSGPGVMGGQLGIGLVDDPGSLVDDERPHAGGPGVHGDSHQRRGGHGRTVASERDTLGPRCARAEQSFANLRERASTW